MFIYPASASALTLRDAIEAAGESSDLVMCLDAGDIASWPGSGQQWFDRSETASHYYLGDTAGAEGIDPSFVGVAGGIADEYCAFAGANRCSPPSVPGWYQAFISSGAEFSLFAIERHPALGTHFVHSATGTGLYTGTTLDINSGKTYFAIHNGSGVALAKAADTALSANSWHAMAVSLNKADIGFMWADGGYLRVGGADTWSAAFTSPAGSAYPPRLGSTNHNTGLYYSAAGSRIAGMAIWSRSLSKSALDALFALQRERYGI